LTAKREHPWTMLTEATALEQTDMLKYDDALALMTESCPVSPLSRGSPTPNVLAAIAPTDKKMSLWTYDEDAKLRAAVQNYGNRWRKIAGIFPDRTEAMCRNRYTRMLAPNRPNMKNWKQPRNRCNACGELKKGHSCKEKARLFAINRFARELPTTGVVVPYPSRPVAPTTTYDPPMSPLNSWPLPLAPQAAPPAPTPLAPRPLTPPLAPRPLTSAVAEAPAPAPFWASATAEAPEHPPFLFAEELEWAAPAAGGA